MSDVKRIDAALNPESTSGRVGELTAGARGEPEVPEETTDRTVGEVLDRIVDTPKWDHLSDDGIDDRRSAAEVVADYAGEYLGREADRQSRGPRVVR